MNDTSLSPRLRHLLLHEDRQTGRMIMPGRDSLRSSISDGISPGPLSSSLPKIGLSPPSRNSTSPTVSPTTFAFAPSPYDKARPLPSDGSVVNHVLPPPVARPTSSIFSLLNGSHPTSPPSTSSSCGSLRGEQDRDRDYREKEKRRATPPYPPPRPRTQSHCQPPLSAPIASHSQTMYFDERPVYPPNTPSSSHSDGTGRPGLLRRHSSHPYEYSPSSSRPTTAYATGPIYEADYAAMGARAPISRTTKACNACRSRKVRCDAGGGEMGPCSRCRESGVQCVYTGVQKKRGPCPGPRRPSTQSQSAASHRSSVGSIQSYVVTPTDEQPWSSRSSYGFPPPPPPPMFAGPAPVDPAEWSSVAPQKNRPTSSSNIPGSSGRYSFSVTSGSGSHEPAVLSWPAMAPAVEVVDRGMFDQDYAITSRPRSRDLNGASRVATEVGPPPSSRGNEPRSLPPLRVAIDRGPYYER
ncbi:hypothetical protein I316_07636 [Kwoniella heveanensis BCC8398]|uniref:Zn(2)-C6 fungal-type domain-containing protein n=1 Tax=Kwoniella heveanensis BCC8398 TaxID=1296120 RepID=A0A1B9GIB8_9TREE|nr:hypothetical protein I316_07636 [Kwoniella heveanensis BCC8398]